MFSSREKSLQVTHNDLYKNEIFQSNEGLVLHARSKGAHINQNDSFKDLQKIIIFKFINILILSFSTPRK